MKRVVTDVNTKLDTLTYSDMSEEAINKNELLINELLTVIKADDKYISQEDYELIEKHKATQILINELCVELGIESLSQIGPYVNELKYNHDRTLRVLDNRNSAYEKKNEYVLKLKDNVENKDQYIERLKKSNEQKQEQINKLKVENSKNKKTISNYKNRKVIRILDRLAGK